MFLDMFSIMFSLGENIRLGEVKAHVHVRRGKRSQASGPRADRFASRKVL